MIKNLLLAILIMVIGLQFANAQSSEADSLYADSIYMYFPFDGNLTDASSNNVYMYLSKGDATYSTGKFGQCKEFHKTALVTAADAFNPFGSFTIACWINMDSTTTELGHAHTWIHQTDVSGEDAGRIHLEVLSEVDGVGSFTDAVRCDDSTHATETGTWYFVANVKDTVAGKRYLYVNGECVDTVAAGTESNNGGLVIGARKNMTSLPASGKMDDLLITKQVLSQALLQKIMEKGVTAVLAGEDDGDDVGISNQSSANEVLSVYPNPTSGSIAISMNSNLSKADYTIVNIAGKTVANGTYFNGQSIDVSQNQAGIYFINVKTNLNTYTFKFIVK